MTFFILALSQVVRKPACIIRIITIICRLNCISISCPNFVTVNPDKVWYQTSLIISADCFKFVKHVISDCQPLLILCQLIESLELLRQCIRSPHEIIKFRFCICPVPNRQNAVAFIIVICQDIFQNSLSLILVFFRLVRPLFSSLNQSIGNVEIAVCSIVFVFMIALPVLNRLFPRHELGIFQTMSQIILVELFKISRTSIALLSCIHSNHHAITLCLRQHNIFSLTVCRPNIRQFVLGYDIFFRPLAVYLLFDIRSTAHAGVQEDTSQDSQNYHKPNKS